VSPQKKKTSVPEDKLQLYERLVESVVGTEAKSNFGSGYTAVNGNMYSMISKHGVFGIRLPEPDRSAFLERYDTEIFRADPPGRRRRSTSRCRRTCSRIRRRSCSTSNGAMSAR
jgi:hypothetical protein